MGSIEVEKKADQDAVHSQSIQEVVAKLEGVDMDLARGLAALDGAPDGVVAATIAAYRLGTRALLGSLGLLEDRSAASDRLRISERGRLVIAACAENHPRADVDVDSALRTVDEALSGRRGNLKVR